MKNEDKLKCIICLETYLNETTIMNYWYEDFLHVSQFKITYILNIFQKRNTLILLQNINLNLNRMINSIKYELHNRKIFSVLIKGVIVLSYLWHNDVDYLLECPDEYKSLENMPSLRSDGGHGLSYPFETRSTTFRRPMGYNPK